MNINDYPLWTAIITPFHEDGSLDKESFAGLLKEQEAARNGVLVLGSTGEALNLTRAEKEEVLSFAIEQNLSVPLMVGVGGSDLQGTKQWIEYLNTLPIKAMLLVMPLYAKPETQGQYLWFKELLDTANHACMLYNVPSRTGKSMSYDAVKMLAQHENFWALKEASGSVEDFKKYRASAPNVKIYSGDDGMTPSFCEHGASGLVSVASNAWPSQTAEYVRQCLNQTLSKEDASLWDACAGALFCVSNPIPVKRLLAEENKIKTPVLKLPLSHLDLSQAATVSEASLRINNWYNDINK